MSTRAGLFAARIGSPYRFDKMVPRSDFQDSNPVTTSYVIGPPRSGTTLVGYLLAGLPGVLSLSEPHLALEAMPTWKMHRFHRRLQHEIGLARTTPPFRGGHSAYHRFLERLTAASGFTRLVAKETWRTGAPLPVSWNSSSLLRDLRAAAADRTTLLIRHPYDTAASTIRLLRFNTNWIGRVLQIRWRDLPYFPDRLTIVRWAARNWCDFLSWAQTIEQPPIRYEDLVLQPEMSVPRLCAELGLLYRPEMLDFSTPRNAFGGLGDPGVMARRPSEINQAAIGRGRQLSERERSEVADLVRDHAEALGYPL